MNGLNSVHSVELYGLTLKIPDQVYFPSDDTDLLIEYLQNMPLEDGAQILEIGSGSGAVSLWLASKIHNRQMRCKIQCIDINPLAIATGKINAQLNSLDEFISFLEGDLFSPLQSGMKFDIIIFNPPYLPQEPDIIIAGNQQPIDHAWNGGEKGLEILSRFLRDAIEFLKFQGDLMFISSSLADQDELFKNLKKYNYSIKTTAKKHIFFEDIILFHCIRENSN
jgi:release factor glutamine methyltransferase